MTESDTEWTTQTFEIQGEVFQVVCVPRTLVVTFTCGDVLLKTYDCCYYDEMLSTFNALVDAMTQVKAFLS